MDTIVLKFGGSSVADNIKLNIVAEKIINFYNQGNKVIVVVSAQGKTTDRLVKEALELNKVPNDREMDVLLSSGEQVSISKLSILLNKLGYKAISLTGWQAGIVTNNTNQNAIIDYIDTSRIEKELNDNKIVIVAGFQGVNENEDITTLGRGGSDTTAVAIAAAINAKHCYIYSDVDGVYTSDPNKIVDSKKLKTLSYEEMLDISSEGAKVLHNRCVTIAEKFNVPIETKSTFSNKKGTIICNSPNTICGDADMNNNENAENLEAKKIKSIVRNKNLSRVSIIGYGCTYDNKILSKVFKFIIEKNLKIFNINIDECKITINFKEEITDSILQEFHDVLF